MRYEKNRTIFGIDEWKIQKIAKLLIIPAIAVILIAVILIGDLGSGNNEGGQSAASSSVPAAVSEHAGGPASQESTDELFINDFEDYGLQKDAVPEIAALVEKYQKAKISGDADLMYEVFGRLDTVGLEELQKKMDTEKAVYESYSDTACYTIPGVEKDSYLAYVSTRLKFAGVDTPAPMLIWAYCVKGPDGYYMKEPDKLTPEEQDLLDHVSASEDVKVLDSTMRTQLAQAVLSDAKLAQLYEIWSDSSQVPQPAPAVQSAPASQPAGTEPSTTFQEPEIHIGS